MVVNAWKETPQEEDVPKRVSSLYLEPHVFLWCEGTKALIWRKLSWETAKAKLDKKGNSSKELQDWETTKTPSQPFSAKNDNLQRVTSGWPSQCHTSTVWADSIVGVPVGSKKGEEKKKKIKKRNRQKNSCFAYKAPKVGEVSAYIQNSHQTINIPTFKELTQWNQKTSLLHKKKKQQKKLAVTSI